MDALPSASADTLPSGFDPAGFVGTLAADGQHLRVAALVTTPTDHLALITLVGYETSVSAALARLLRREPLGFLPTARCAWAGPTQLTTMPGSYWLWRAALRGTRETTGVLFPHCASIAHGLQHPPSSLPDPSPVDAHASLGETLAQLRATTSPDQVPPARLLLADATAPAPTPAAFFGQLKVLRAVVLPSLVWVDVLWQLGLTANLITPLRAMGLRAWQLAGDVRAWNAVVSHGVRQGMLPTTPPTAADRQRLAHHPA